MRSLEDFKYWLVALFGGLSTFLGWKGILLVVLFILAVVDFATGWANAIKNGNWKSKTARDGIVHKVAMFAVIAVAGLIDLSLSAFCSSFPGLPFDYPSIILPLVTAWYIITEIGSVLENSSLLGVPVPHWLLKMLDVGKKILDKTAEEKIPKEIE